MTTTNPEQWADKVLDDVIIAWSEHGHSAGIEAIQAAFAEREARLVGALAKGGFIMTETHNIGEYRARKLVIGFRNGSDADLAMEAVALAIKAYRDAT